MTDATTGTTAGMAGQAVGVAREVETNLGVVGVLVLVIIAMAAGWLFTVRWAKQVALASSVELGRWAPHMAALIRQARVDRDIQRNTLAKLGEVDEKIDKRLPDPEPRSRRGDR